MPKPVCVKCQRFFRPKRSGYSLVEGMPKEKGALPGTTEPEKWQPYKLWMGDLWECEGCGIEIVTGFAPGPISEHHQEGFEEEVRNFGATLQVNDC